MPATLPSLAVLLQLGEQRIESVHLTHFGLDALETSALPFDCGFLVSVQDV
jgi:hypothetical protein